jgi:hypothetical protein
VNLKISESWRSPWTVSILGDRDKVRVDGGHMRLWIDGGSRGNPGPSAIGVVIEDAEGRLLQTVSQVIGTGTNNVAEYRALLAGLTVAAKLAATTVEFCPIPNSLSSRCAANTR